MSSQQNIYLDEARKLISRYLKDGGQFEALHTYTTTEGAPIFWRLRLKNKDGKKMFPMHQASNGDFVLEEPNFNNGKKPLYRLHELASRTDEPIYIVEGEKCADALAALGLLATTSGGASSAACADWSPLHNRAAVIWPDNNTAGFKYAGNVAEILTGFDCSINQIDISILNLPEGGDCVDWLLQHPEATKSDIQKLAFIATQLNYPNFEVRVNGVFYCKDKSNSEWICSKLIVKALTRDADGINWGRVLELTDADNIVRQWTMPAEMLAGGDDPIKELFRLGLRIAPGAHAKRFLIEYITNSETNNRARCVLSTGWHDQSFILPHKVFGHSNEIVLLQSDSHISTDYRSVGTLEDWKTHIASLCVGNSRLIFAVSLAFASPLLKIVRSECGGFHFRGESSSGKTTALTVAASVWGGKSYIQNWRATDNGLEGLATQHNDTLLILDELSQIDPKYAGEVAYMLANGQGKARATKIGAARKRLAWRLLFLSSGEISLASHMSEAGKRSKAGQEVRMIDIPADANKGKGIFETLHAFADGAIFSETLKINCDRYHGTASEKFLEMLVQSDPVMLHTKIQNIQTQFMQLMPEALHGQIKRVAQHFALVAAAGELATEYGITAWQAGAVIQAVKTCFDAWLHARDGGTGSHEHEKAMEQVRHFFQENESRFAVFDDPEKYKSRLMPNKCAGFVTNKGDFYVYPKTFSDEICKGIGSKKEIAKIAAQHGWLLEGEEDDKKTACSSVWVPTQGKTIRLYHFSSAVTGEDKK